MFRLKNSPDIGTFASVERLTNGRLGEWRGRSRHVKLCRDFKASSKLPLGEQFFTVGVGLTQIRSADDRLSRSSKRVDVDHGQFVGWRLEDPPIVMRFGEFAGVGGRAACGRNGRRLERLAQVTENFPNWPRLSDERNEPDVAVAVLSQKGELIPNSSHEIRLVNL